MKVAIIHDWLTGFRGGERVLEAISELFPDATIYTLFHKKGSTSSHLESRTIVTTFLDKFPNIHEGYRNYLPLFPLAIKSLQLPHDLDLVISSSHCVAKGISIPSGAKHICYIHSPMRYIYDQFDSYFGKQNILKKMVGYSLLPYLRTWDHITNSSVNAFISNSSFVASRVKHFYHRDSVVIYPFVDLKDFRALQSTHVEKQDFYLMVTAFAPNKRVDLAIAAFRELGWKLKIVGCGQDELELLKNQSPNIEFLGSRPRSEIVKLMAEAKAFIFPGTEDFGITPLESLAAGTPVIAYYGGGVVETLNEKVAQFFYEQTQAGLVKALRSFDASKYDREVLYHRAEDFSKEKFRSNILNYIRSLDVVIR